MANLKPNSDMKPLQDAGIGRQLADWTIGRSEEHTSELQSQR